MTGSTRSATDWQKDRRYLAILTPAPTRTMRQRERRRTRKGRSLTALSLLLALAALLTIGIPMYGRVAFAREQADTRQTLQTTVDGMTTDRADRMLRQAEEYNERLAASGQQIIGEATDPFGNPAGDFSGSDDTDYTNALDMGDGIMGTLTIPRIGETLVIRHGSSSDVLRNGVGHLHGTSLPIGGPSTHAALTGHRGLPDRLLFTRLDELRLGDAFYLNVLGRTLSYKVTGITVVDPDDVAGLRVQPGRDLVTLVTCTPYGVNTQRLLVTGERASMPDAVPYERDAPKDPRPRILAAFGAVLAPGWWWARKTARPPVAARHGRRQ